MLDDAGGQPQDLWNPLTLLLAAAVVMAGSGVAALLVGRRGRAADRTACVLLGTGALLGLAGVAWWFGHGTTLTLAYNWGLPWGRFSLALDGVSAVFLLPLLLVPALASVYSLGYWAEEEQGGRARRARVFMGFLAGALVVLPLARDGIVFLMAFEVMTLAAFLLITTEDEKAEARAAGWMYLIASHVSLMFLFAAFALYRATTGSFELEAAGARGMGVGAKSAVFLLALVGFGIKAGVMPLHVWLPSAHASAPSHVSAVLSGVVLKVGVYGLVRMAGILPDPPMYWGLLLLLLGAGSGVIGVAYAIAQHDLKRLLAYHSIENIGIIVMGLGMALLGRWGHHPALIALGMGCALMHTWNHALFKSLLFLSAGAAVHATGTRQIERMGGLARAMPWSAGLFILGAVAICGLPPLNGFISELFLFRGALGSLSDGGAALASLAAPVLALIGALACACFVKVIGCVFLGQPRAAAAERAHECGRAMRAPMLALAGACLVLGVAPALGAPALDIATGAWLGADATAPPLATLVPFGVLALIVGGLVVVVGAGVGAMAASALARRAPRAGTWDCGFVAPSARMQYSASSLARGLVQLFALVLRPREHAEPPTAMHPRAGAFEEHVDDVTLERALTPLCRGVADRFERLRHWQTGRIQGYILYVLLTTLCLLLLVIPLLDILRRLVNQ